MKQHWTAKILEDQWGDYFIELPPEVIRHLDLQEGDSLLWKSVGDKSFELIKQYNEDEDVGC